MYQLTQFVSKFVAKLKKYRILTFFDLIIVVNVQHVLNGRTDFLEMIIESLRYLKCNLTTYFKFEIGMTILSF